MPIHMLHVHKTGGTALRYALQPVAEKFDITLHRHNTRLRSLAGEAALIIFRDPVTRFVSGFNSRLRMGLPHHHFPWNENEASAFAMFKTPNDLAEGLSSGGPREKAQAAMKSIRTVARHQHEWATIEEVRSGNVQWVGFTETLEEDFGRLKSELSLPSDLLLPHDDTLAHRTPAGHSTDLSSLGRRNIEAWFADDVRLVAELRERRAQ